jgi:hypothetical protein
MMCFVRLMGMRSDRTWWRSDETVHLSMASGCGEAAKADHGPCLQRRDDIDL